jgi:heme-degrading monooxygenase HmoA
MIVRIWHGRVLTDHADRYADFLQVRAIPDYRSVAGNLGVQVLRRVDGGLTHFLTVSTWESVEAIRRFAGDDYEAAKYYPEDHEFLIEFEPKVMHYEVVGQA